MREQWDQEYYSIEIATSTGKEEDMNAPVCERRQ